MATTAEEPSSRFVPVSETMRDRNRRARLGAAWPRIDLLALLGITLMAAVLRFWQIEIWSVSAAEAETWRAATASARTGTSLVEIGLRVMFEQGLLPAQGEGWLRLPFLFAGTLAVPVLALVGEALVGRRAALLAALLLALSPWHVEVCQTATGHGAALTLALLALGSAFVAGKTGSTASWWLFGGSALLAGLCHPIGWLCVPVAIVGWRARQWRTAERGDRVRVVGTATLQLVVIVAIVYWARPPGEAADPRAVAAVAWSWIIAAGLPVVTLALLVVMMAAGRARRRLLTIALTVPVAIVVVLGLVAVAPERDHALLALPALLLLSATGALLCFDGVRRALGGGNSVAVQLPAGMIGAAIVLDLAVGTFLYSTARRGSRPDWRRARDQIVRTTQRTSLTVLAAAGRDSLLYYLRPDHWRSTAGDPHPGIAVDRFDPHAVDLAAATDSAVVGSADLFLVMLEDELATLVADADRKRALASFELRDVLPCAGTLRDETIYVYRWIGER